MFSWKTNLIKGLIPGVWGLVIALVAQKIQQYQETGAVHFSAEESQLVISALTGAGVWIVAQFNNWRKNHPSCPTWLRDFWGLWPVAIVCVIVGCATGPTVTVTYPDGRVETRTDTAAMAAYVEAARLTVDTIKQTILEVEQQKANSEALADKEAAADAAARRAFWLDVLNAREALDQGAEVAVKTQRTEIAIEQQK